jgi:hypothetical protein
LEEGYSEWRTGGIISIGLGIAFGLIVPFFHEKPNTNVAQANFPFNLELVSSTNRSIDGVGIYYSKRF